MRIALFGYGKMGKAIEQIALQRGHTISLRIDLDNRATLTAEHLKTTTDVVIEFSSPESAVANIRFCLEAGVAIVSGTTGWLKHLDDIHTLTNIHKGAFFYASNYSIGVNIFFELNKKLAELMNTQPQYEVSIKEIHHTQKLDAPSGTAITLAEEIINGVKRKEKWVKEQNQNDSELSIFSERTNPAPGTHHVLYQSAIDDIEIIHTAHSRTGFATGAVLAAEFLSDKKGIFGMKDMLAF